MSARNRIGEDRLPRDGEAHASVESALLGLDPSLRAALELSIRHQRSPAQVADVTGIDEAKLEVMRARALDSIAAELGIFGPGAREKAEHRLEVAMSEPAIEDRGEQVPADAWRSEYPVAVEPSDRSLGAAKRLIAPVVVLVGIVITIVLIASNGASDDDLGIVDERPAPERGSTEPRGGPDERGSSPNSPGAGLALTPLPGAPGSGTVEATVVERSGARVLELSLSELPDPRGEYTAWLYSSLIDSEPLGSVDSGNGTIEAKLPRNALAYELLDISAQRPGDTAHSGSSVFRVPLRTLLAN